MLFTLVILLSTFATLNEYVIKPAMGISRPSHAYILKQANSRAPLDSIYTLVTAERRSFLKGIIGGDTIHFKTIDPRILNHWIDEAGYSFPSGHSFNAFLLGSILAWCIYELRGRKLGVLPLIPLIWAALVAFSRVAIGAHTALDVTFGAGLGLIVSHTLIALPVTRRLILAYSKTTQLSIRAQK